MRPRVELATLLHVDAINRYVTRTAEVEVVEGGGHSQPRFTITVHAGPGSGTDDQITISIDRNYIPLFSALLFP